MDRTTDTATQYRTIIQRIMTEYAAQYPTYGGDAMVQTLVDEARDHYQIWYTGWRGDERIHFCVLHIDIRDGKVWVQHDGVYESITQKLLDAGIPHKSIVIGFHAPSERRYTPFALA